MSAIGAQGAVNNRLHHWSLTYDTDTGELIGDFQNTSGDVAVLEVTQESDVTIRWRIPPGRTQWSEIRRLQFSPVARKARPGKSPVLPVRYHSVPGQAERDEAGVR